MRITQAMYRGLEDIEADNVDRPLDNGTMSVLISAGLVRHVPGVPLDTWEVTEAGVSALEDRQAGEWDAQLVGYTQQEAYDHENPPLRDDPMEWER